MSLPSSSPARCPECGAELAAGRARCWLCQRNADAEESANPYASPRPLDDNFGFQFSLASLFLITTLVAVGLGAFMVAPGIGVLYTVLCVPALGRTIVAAKQQRRAGAPLTIGEKSGVFLMSFCISVGIGLASSIAFGIACAAGALVGLGAGNFDAVLGFGIGAGLLAAIPLAIWMLYLTRPSNVEFEKKRSSGSSL